MQHTSPFLCSECLLMFKPIFKFDKYSKSFNAPCKSLVQVQPWASGQTYWALCPQRKTQSMLERAWQRIFEFRLTILSLRAVPLETYIQEPAVFRISGADIDKLFINEPIIWSLLDSDLFWPFLKLLGV